MGKNKMNSFDNQLFLVCRRCGHGFFIDTKEVLFVEGKFQIYCHRCRTQNQINKCWQEKEANNGSVKLC